MWVCRDSWRPLCEEMTMCYDQAHPYQVDTDYHLLTVYLKLSAHTTNTPDTLDRMHTSATHIKLAQ